MASWLYITQMFIIYVGIITLVFSLFGCIMNVIIFSTVQMYRSQSCTFFLLISAIIRSVHLFSVGLSRILAIVFRIDLTLISLLRCKMRFYIVQTGFGVSMTCECLATIDRFLVTSRSIKLRRLGNMKCAHRATIGVVTFWLLQNASNFIFVDIRHLLFLQHLVPAFARFIAIFGEIYSNYVIRWFLLTAVPLIICILFGSLTYRNIRTLKNLRQLQGADRQFIYMIFGQIVATVTPIIPSAVFYVYSSSAIYVNQAATKGVDYFIYNILNTLAVLFYGSTFYIFLIVSSTFRQQVKRCFCYFCKKTNIVTPKPTNVLIAQRNPHQ
ncbi:hypothetical protein I4U23_022983 [Adineta vaga]|nr:hypothetical protein I4U23_022983 [Adineta vaga]